MLRLIILNFVLVLGFVSCKDKNDEQMPSTTSPSPNNNDPNKRTPSSSSDCTKKPPQEELFAPSVEKEPDLLAPPQAGCKVKSK